MADIVIVNSIISGLHITRKSSHPDVELKVLPDDSFTIDPDCMKVVMSEVATDTFGVA